MSFVLLLKFGKGKGGFSPPWGTAIRTRFYAQLFSSVELYR